MIGWLDCSAGVSGDMLLGAIVDAGVPLEVLQAAVDAVGVGPVRLVERTVTRGGLGARKVDVDVPATDVVTRTWQDVRSLLERADLVGPVRARALEVFSRLAAAEAGVHRVPVDEVHFHEVGALDAIADIVGACAGLHALGLTALTSSPVVLGAGTTRGAHGPLPVPAPAVLALLAGVPVLAGPVALEMTTPTGAALVAVHATDFGPLPAMVLDRTGTGAGGRDPDEVANVLRLVVGQPQAAPGPVAVVLEANIDDLDPRIWPGVLAALMDAGADDAWLTPVLMKKGRPAHVLSLLCAPDRLELLRRLVLTETSTLGVRTHDVGKHPLPRRSTTVDVDGCAVRVKLGLLDDQVVHAMPEWDDVAAAAHVLDRPARLVLQQAQALAQELY